LAWLEHAMDSYGYLVLFAALLLELMALPLPGEVLMSYAGLMVYQGQLHWGFSVLAAGAGSSLGMTLAYILGKILGRPFFEKHGARVHFGPEKLERTSKWFDRYGNGVLVIAYFLPGIRHITGYFSGIVRIPFRTYMIFAYTGAFLWTGAFISLGKLLGPKWKEFHHTIQKYLLIAGILAAMVFLAVWMYRRYKEPLQDRLIRLLDRSLDLFHSLGRVRLLVSATFIIFLLLLAWMGGLIQDFLANEFGEFDSLTMFLVHVIFDERFIPFMTRFSVLGTPPFLLFVGAATLAQVIWRGKDRLLESGFLVFVLAGGEVWSRGLRALFQWIRPVRVSEAFPGEQTLMTLALAGFAAFLFVRHRKNVGAHLWATLLVLLLSFLAGLSRISLGLQLPSDAVAGYAFGGVWLSLNILLLEIFRLLRRKKGEAAT